MALRFKLAEGLASGTRRMARAQLGIATKRLREGKDPERDIHEARKCLKRTRALLRLVRDGLAPGVFERENRELAGIGRSLSGVRDLHVLQQTLTRLEQASHESDAPTFNEMRSRITDLIRERETSLDDGVSTSASAGLAAARKRFSDLDVQGGSATLQKGLERSYRAGRSALERALAAPDTHTLHELRKQAQHHWRQMSLLHAAWPQAHTVRVVAARELSQLLGEEHDLAVLQLACRKGRPLALPDRERRWLNKLCKHRRAELRSLIEPRASRLFALTPKVFAKSVAAQWRAARTHPEPAQATEPPAVSSAAPPTEAEPTRH